MKTKSRRVPKPVKASPEPQFDRHGYPSDDTLADVEHWSPHDPKGLLDFVTKAWHFSGNADRRIGRSDGWRFDKYTLVTGGWSGNESLISAMEQNTVFWMMCWWSSERGGRYAFRVPERYFTPTPRPGKRKGA